MKKTFSVVSLGCFRNTYDSDVLAQKFLNSGYTYLPAPLFYNQKDTKEKKCKLLIVNTCGFIDKAKEESLGVIREAVEFRKKCKVEKILVFGCLVNRYRKLLQKEFPEVDEWRGTEEFGNELPKKKTLVSFTDFLKICEGCLNKCSFCAIPLIKGPLKSKQADKIVMEARRLENLGVKELNIIGQDITSWGKDLQPKQYLTTLVKRILDETKRIRWIRLIYTHPRNFSDSLIELIAKEKRICKYIDLPIQHINDRILKLMNRKITKRQIITLIKKIRKMIPDCVIRTSIIVGFPTETETEFKELLSFLSDIEFQRLGAFIYSREEGTLAYDLTPQVHYNTKKRRFEQLMILQKEIAQQSNNRFVGKIQEVLVEGNDRDVSIGRTQYDAPDVDGVVFIRRHNLKIGNFYKTKIIDALGYDLIGA